MHVRDARADDWSGVSSLLAQLGRPDVRGQTDEPEHRHAFEAYLARPDTIALVADDEGALVGFVDVELRQRLNFLRAQAWIPDLVVAETARRRGAGRALLAEAERRARAAGCWGMSLESASWREEAHAFYESVGWSASGKAFAYSLTGEPWPPASPGAR